MRLNADPFPSSVGRLKVSRGQSSGSVPRPPAVSPGIRASVARPLGAQRVSPPRLPQPLCWHGVQQLINPPPPGSYYLRPLSGAPALWARDGAPGPACAPLCCSMPLLLLGAVGPRFPNRGAASYSYLAGEPEWSTDISVESPLQPPPPPLMTAATSVSSAHVWNPRGVAPPVTIPAPAPVWWV